ncbi:MAG: hypoxanthine phosphoribosyltransferase [Saprospiraceae bacterium]|uniref:Hypoxanthine phosphoribosyltransferase n=1 Tax=Candidatus Opimibacter skivensis TaxID=2982028 RepID=A0A9D7XQ15_9BACT|nr:hypoxanthine phosphoribosyltransferase [Candidatus Opimibacter skivensis]
MKDVQLHNLTFEPFISEAEIEKVVMALSVKIDKDYKDRNPILLIVLNGAFIFAADLVRQLSIPLRLDFVKVSSYSGTESTGKLGEHFLWNMPLEGQDVLIIEDIVDTGHTLHHLNHKIKSQNPASVEIACLLIKPIAYKYPDVIKYQGMEIPNEFVVGYGLDYNGIGRDLGSIYKKKDI